MPKRVIYTCIVCGEELESSVLSKEYKFGEPGPIVEVNIPLNMNVYKRVPSLGQPWQWKSDFVCEKCVLKTLKEGEDV